MKASSRIFSVTPFHFGERPNELCTSLFTVPLSRFLESKLDLKTVTIQAGGTTRPTVIVVNTVQVAVTFQ